MHKLAHIIDPLTTFWLAFVLISYYSTMYVAKYILQVNNQATYCHVFFFFVVLLCNRSKEFFSTEKDEFRFVFQFRAMTLVMVM